MRRFYLSGVFFLLFCFSWQSFGAVLDACHQAKCIAVVDAGSSGSRVHVFKVTHNEQTYKNEILELWSHKISPGFSSLEPTFESIQDYMNRLLTETPANTIPIYFYATAGMRLIPEARQDKYYRTLRTWFHQSNHWALQDARTISGKEEGTFGWLSVNYQLNQSQSSENALTGVLDMGGASVQIAFPISDNAVIDKEDLVTVTLNGQKIRLFVHSFLGLGQNVFAQQFLDAKSCFSSGYPLPSGESGTGNPEACQLGVTHLINSVHEVNLKVQPILQNNQPSKWYAMGGVDFLVNDPVFGPRKPWTTGDEIFNNTAGAVCQQDWSNLVEQSPDNAYIHNFCLFSSYYYALLVNGYGIDPSETIHFMSPEKTLDWTIGVALQHT